MYKIIITFKHVICCQVFVSSTVRAVGPIALQWIMGKGNKSAVSTMYLFPFQLTRFSRMGLCVLCVYCCVGACACTNASPHLACGISWCMYVTSG